jgi:hypothetical protein
LPFGDLIFQAHAKAHIFEHLRVPCPADSHSKPLALLFIQFCQVLGEIQQVCLFKTHKMNQIHEIHMHAFGTAYGCNTIYKLFNQRFHITHVGGHPCFVTLSHKSAKNFPWYNNVLLTLQATPLQNADHMTNLI